MKDRKAAGLDAIPAEIIKASKYSTHQLNYCTKYLSLGDSRNTSRLKRTYLVKLPKGVCRSVKIKEKKCY